MSELRRDLVTGDWVIIAPERAKRPDEFLRKPDRTPTPKETCPFEDLQKTGNWPPILAIPDAENWRIVVIPNKFPALSHQHVCAEIFQDSIYERAQGVGHHELVLTRDHNRPFVAMTVEEGLDVFRMFQARYKTLSEDACVRYVTAFLNYGPSTGGSVYHPHYQIISLPIIPPDISHSLEGSARYFRTHNRCVHCAMIEHELQLGSRIVGENAFAVALTPFASRDPFEVRIYPKSHEPFFERTGQEELRAVVMLLQSVLHKIKEYMRDPDLNFFIHTSPLKDQDEYANYHWHIEIFPKLSILGGFELSTGTIINIIDPDKAARLLREGKFE